VTDLKEASGAPVVDPIYVEARRVLLDALTALAPQGSAVIVAGAQAVYLRAGDADVAVAPYTTDGDLRSTHHSSRTSPCSKAQCAELASTCRK
jgi:hypothetical protein